VFVLMSLCGHGHFHLHLCGLYCDRNLVWLCPGAAPEFEPLQHLFICALLSLCAAIGIFIGIFVGSTVMGILFGFVLALLLRSSHFKAQGAA